MDRLDPQEIPEGKVTAFGLTLPRDMKVTFSGPNEIDAIGRINAERVANYVRKRVEVDGIELGAARTVFPSARVLGATVDRQVRIEVMVTNEGTQLVVRNLAKPKVLEPGLTPGEIWQRNGFDPTGTKIDPSKM